MIPQARDLKPTAASLALLDWAIYVTNLPREEFSAHKVSALYALRWRVEIVFKSIKSAGLRLDEALAGRKSKAQVETLAYAALILAVFNARMTAVPMVAPKAGAKSGAQGASNRSLLKSAKLVSLLLLPLLLEWLAQGALDALSTRSPDLLACHANYDQRKRPHFAELLATTLALS